MEKDQRNTTRIAVLAVIGVLVIIAAVVWSIFYSRSQAPSPPSPQAVVPAVEQPAEPAAPEPQAAQEPKESEKVEETEETEELKETEEPPEDLETTPAEENEEIPAPDAEETPVSPEEDEAALPPATQETAAAPAEPEKPEVPEDKSPPAPAKEQLPKITFIDEEVEKDYRTSRFFTINRVVPCPNPFAPPQNRILPRELMGRSEQITGTTVLPEVPEGTETGEIPLLPLPEDALGTGVQVRLIGVSQSGENATAMFSINDGDGEQTVLAHAGWLVGNDYVFVGAENGRAKIFNRKSNKVIQLATGETL